MLSEIGRFLVALIFLLLTFGSAISVLEHPYFEAWLVRLAQRWDAAGFMFLPSHAGSKDVAFHGQVPEEMRDIPKLCCRH